MKRKVYFLISSIVQILVSIYAIISAKEIISNLTKQIGMYPESLQTRINGLFENSGLIFIIVLAIITTILNSLIIYWALNNRLLKHKGKVFAFSIISLFMALYPLAELCAIINIIVIATTKRTNPEDFPDEREKMPAIQKEEVNTKKIVLAIILLMIYFSQFLWSHYIPNSPNSKIIVGGIFYILLIGLSVAFFYELFSDNYKVFKQHFKAYFQNLIGSVGKFYLIYFAVAMITVFIANADTSVNQNNVEALPLWYSLPLAIIYAPIVEETLFRGCIRRFIKNDKIFIIVSAITFGLLHTIFTEVNFYNAIILGIPYIVIGGFLAYLYSKTNNMFTNMSFHAFHNTMAMIITILIKGI